MITGCERSGEVQRLRSASKASGPLSGPVDDSAGRANGLPRAAIAFMASMLRLADLNINIQGSYVIYYNLIPLQSKALAGFNHIHHSITHKP
jgi:hypothetical protein